MILTMLFSLPLSNILQPLKVQFNLSLEYITLAIFIEANTSIKS